MYIVASPYPDPNPRGGGQLPNPKSATSTLTSATGEEKLTPNPNGCNSTLTSGTRGIYPHRYISMLMSGVTAYVFSTCRAAYLGGAN